MDAKDAKIVRFILQTTEPCPPNLLQRLIFVNDSQKEI